MRIRKYLLASTILFGTVLSINAQQSDLPTVPYGRLVKASLINTVESGAAAPVIGIVSQDVCFNGKKIIPANSEIHGLSQPEAIRDRIACNNQFVILFGNGTEMRVQGVVLDRDDANGDGSGRTDGSYGMKGDIIILDAKSDKDGYSATDGSSGVKGQIPKKSFVRVPSGHHFYLYVQTTQPKSY
jgi:hypothetical protein